MPQAHEALAVIVLSYGPRPTLAEAVASLLSQDPLPEIVVVHSGSGTVDLRDERVRVVTSAERLLPGGARNLGIASTSARYIAFLADDCIAGEGWVRNRLQRHIAGARAVSSALACHRPRNPVALAAHLSLYFRRMPRTNPDLALRYGVSYDSALFDQHGLFDAQLETGEDTQFNRRLAPEDAPAWAPEVVTVHRGPETPIAFLRTQARRGRRMADAWTTLGALGTLTRTIVARNALSRTTTIMREMWSLVEPHHRASAIFSAPLIVCGNIAYAWGALRAQSGGRA